MIPPANRTAAMEKRKASPVNELGQRLARLTPEQRALVEERLRQHKKHTISGAPSAVLAKRSPAEPASLSFSQERLWFLEQLEGASATYNICSATRFRGMLRCSCLEQALAEIVRRHELLRTTFPRLEAANQQPIQKISEFSEFQLEVGDLSSEIETQKEGAAREIMNKIAAQPMSLAKGPLFRAHLIRLDPENHILLVVMHHIVSDGWSFDVFFGELSALYADFFCGRKPSLPPLEIQYADFAQWQRRLLRGEELERQLFYWRNRLAGAPPLLELPTDFPRPSEQSYRGSSCERLINAALTEKLRELSRQTGATLFMTLLAGFKALIWRYSGQDDILVGTPVTCRTRVELESLIGFFVNMLVLRTDLSNEPTVQELINRVRHTTLDAFSHQDLPFEKLVREMRPERSLSHAPFFQTALMFLQDGHDLMQFPGLITEAVPIGTGTAKYDLTLYASESSKEVKLCLEYATDLFCSETADRLLAHYECLLEDFVADSNARVSQLNLLGSLERQQILVKWNQTKADYPRNERVHTLFEEQAARVPDAIAVEFGSHTLTYAELDHRANVLASELQKKGLKPEALVGLYVDRSLEMVVGLLGIVKAGGAYVPLDPSFPKDRLAFMAADAQIPFLVTQKGLLPELPEHQAQVLCIDALDFAQPASPHLCTASASDLAYVLYTSGSTGRPKGVQISHRALVNFLYSMRREPGLREEDILLAITTLSFDIAGLELFLPLIIGARVVIAPRDVTVDGPPLAKLIANCGATVMQATPATWRMLIDSGWQGDGRLKALCGGEAFGPDLTEQLLKRCGELWNMYGPTETTIWSTTERLLPGQIITIGRPIANTQVYILDGNAQPVPAGVTGELFIGGDGVAIGYLNRPELTRERFISNPLNSEPGDILYRTGDLARFRADGRIEFLGRGDHQVKIRGFRIELGEIEASLSRIDGVSRAVVVAREDTPGNKRLVAYVVPKVWKVGEDQDTAAVSIADDPSLPALDSAKLRAELRSNLPEYMIPSVYVFLESLPLTANGKVDRKALPRPNHSSGVAQSYEAPRGAIEEKLAGIMASILNVPRVGRGDSFFDLGGHSILAVTLFNEIDRVFGKRLPLATLFRSPAVEGLATALESGHDRSDEWPSLIPIQPHGSKMRFFCVHGAGGNVLLYRDLARHLGTEYPFYGLQSQGLDGKASPLETVEAMADKYLREIRGLQPEGPYYLGGYCLGGTIAYEIAQRLRADRQEVVLVALLDTYNFARMEPPRLFGYLWQKMEFHFGNLIRLPLRNWPGYFSNKLRVARDGELASLWKALRSVLRTNGAAHGFRSIEASVQEVNDRAAEAYQPKPYAGRVALFKPQVNYYFYPDPQMGWGDLVTGGLPIVELPVNPHAMLVEPYVQILATRLKEEMEKANPEKMISQPHRKQLAQVVNGVAA
jgi:amino acid adenylation domain-containing protein